MKLRIEASPSEFLASLEHMVSPNNTAETLDSVLQLTTQVVNGLNHAIKSGKDSVLWALLIELCSISGILFHLQQLVQDEKSKNEWMATVKTLCAPYGPLENFKANLELLASKFAPNISLNAIRGILRLASGHVNFVEVKIAIEKQRVIFNVALQNDSQ